MDTTTVPSADQAPIGNDYFFVVYNDAFGGFSLSNDGIEAYNKLRIAKSLPPIDVGSRGRRIERTDPDLVEVVRTLGSKANGRLAKLAIESVPIEYVNLYSIRENDGAEWVLHEPSTLIVHTLKSYQLNDHSVEENISLLKRMIELAQSQE